MSVSEPFSTVCREDHSRQPLSATIAKQATATNEVAKAVADMRRSIRYIRLHAKDWGVDPDRLGVMGGSAGGHLTLMLATTADDGDPNSQD